MSNVTREQLDLRIEIARDVLTRIEEGLIKPASGKYYDYYGAKIADFISDPHKLPLKDCRVCVLGAMFVTLLDKPNHWRDWTGFYQDALVEVKREYFVHDEGLAGGIVISSFLLEVFDLHQLQLIEAAYEGTYNLLRERTSELTIEEREDCNTFWERYESSTEGLTLICNNIIRHNGVFDPTDQS